MCRGEGVQGWGLLVGEVGRKKHGEDGRHPCHPLRLIGLGVWGGLGKGGGRGHEGFRFVNFAVAITHDTHFTHPHLPSSPDDG